MSCPMYEDYTRKCIKFFKEFVSVDSFKICESDRYKERPMYRIINKTVQPCKFTKECIDNENYISLNIDEIIQMTNTYCLSDNRINCEIYKLRKAGKDVPNDLMADGSRVEVKSQ